jgi:aminoglycoside/choline kinase family phosphotransferase
MLPNPEPGGNEPTLILYVNTSERWDYGRILAESTTLADTLSNFAQAKCLKLFQNSLKHWSLSEFWLKVAEATFQVFLKWYLQCHLSIEAEQAKRNKEEARKNAAEEMRKQLELETELQEVRAILKAW